MQAIDRVERLESKANPRFLLLKQLAHDNLGAKQQGRVWLEGDHLVKAAWHRGYRPAVCIATDAGHLALKRLGVAAAYESITVTTVLWRELSQLGSACQFAWVVNLPIEPSIDPSIPSVILDRIQDPGNVGSILRSAAAFGYSQVLALVGTASLWSPKVLRAAMGAHFGLRLHESLHTHEVLALPQFRCVTSSHGGRSLNEVAACSNNQSLAWIFGNEGQGAASEFLESADLRVKIDQPGGEESLNVAAAAAICLHASMVPFANK